MKMARTWVLRSLAFRNAIRSRVRPILKPSSTLSSAPLPSNSSLFATAAVASFQFSFLPPFQNSLSFCSASAPSDVVLVNSEEEFNNILKKVQENSLHAIFYFSAVWCGPCRFISPTVGEISKKYPNVTTYKVDIDQEGVQGTLAKLHITSVPTLHFFQNGKKADELIGADVARLNSITEKLFK